MQCTNVELDERLLCDALVALVHHVGVLVGDAQLLADAHLGLLLPLGVGVADDRPEVPAGVVEVASAGLLKVGDVEDAAGGRLDELAAVVDGAKVRAACGTEVIGRYAIRPSVLRIDIGERIHIAIVRPHFLNIADKVNIPVIIVILGRYSEAAGASVRELSRIRRNDPAKKKFVIDGVHIPGVGRILALSVFIYERKPVGIEVSIAISVLPGIDRRVGRFRVRARRLDAVRAEHKVKLPTIGDAVTVVIGVVRLKRKVFPRLRLIHLLFRRSCKAYRGKVPNKHILVKRGERLGVLISRVNRRRLAVAELIIDLRMDESHINIRDGVNLEVGACEDVCSEASVRNRDCIRERFIRHDRHVIVGRDKYGCRNDIADTIDTVRIADEILDSVLVCHHSVNAVRHRERHIVALGKSIGIGKERVGIGEARFPTVGKAVAISIPLLLVGVSVSRLLVARKAVEIDIGSIGTGRRGGCCYGKNVLSLIPVKNSVAVDICVFHIHINRSCLGA